MWPEWAHIQLALLKFENESCRSHMKSCRTVTDDRLLFHALIWQNFAWEKSMYGACYKGKVSFEKELIPFSASKDIVDADLFELDSKFPKDM